MNIVLSGSTVFRTKSFTFLKDSCACTGGFIDRRSNGQDAFKIKTETSDCIEGPADYLMKAAQDTGGNSDLVTTQSTGIRVATQLVNHRLNCWQYWFLWSALPPAPLLLHTSPTVA